MSKTKILIVASDYYKEISNNLIDGVTSYLNEFHFDWIDYEIIYTPGSFEIPFLINRNKKNYAGFIALGCIIRGETYHFELISNEVTRKIMDLSISINKPIGFGVLTCENMNQAIERSKGKNKGKEAASACIQILKEANNITLYYSKNDI